VIYPSLFDEIPELVVEQVGERVVYAWLNTKNGRCYVGQAGRPLAKRFLQHVQQLQAGKHHNKAFQADWDAHGSQAFRFVVLATSRGTWREMDHMEYAWIGLMRGRSAGVYNHPFPMREAMATHHPAPEHYRISQEEFEAIFGTN
jgi:hypothetical protein